MQTATGNNAAHDSYDGDEFDSLVELAQAHFNNCVAEHGSQLFVAQVSGAELYENYLEGFTDPTQRQIHSCHCCRRFFEQYGNLVFVTERGDLVPAMWPSVTGLYQHPMAIVRETLSASRVEGVFAASEAVWKSNNGSAPQWTHFEVVPANVPLHRSRTETPYQAMAAKRENYNVLMRALSQYRRETVDLAVSVLSGEALYRSEKVIGPAQFLQRLHEIRAEFTGKGHRGVNRMWLEIAKAPEGFCHPSSSMIGTLLDDIAAGKSFDAVKRAFDAKMDPSKHQRPQAAPTAGNVRRGEELVAKLGIAPSLERRAGRFEEMQTFWTPRKAVVPEGGFPAGQAPVFGHLRTKDQAAPAKLDLPRATVTWEKFKRTVLPQATRVQLLVRAGEGAYFGTTAPVHADAPPILQWDSEERRNPYAWYVYVSGPGRTPQHWGLRPGTLAEVRGIGDQPSMWNDADGRFSHQGESVFFYVEGAEDSSGSASACLFPEILRGELREVRATIEAYSREARLQPCGGTPACGVRLSKGQPFNQVFLVTTATGTSEYLIDRWD